MKKLIKLKHMKTRKQSIERIFIEDKQITNTNFTVGEKYIYNIDFTNKKVVIKSIQPTCNDKNKLLFHLQTAQLYILVLHRILFEYLDFWYL